MASVPPNPRDTRVRALAWLVSRGVRETACTNDYTLEQLPALMREFGVVFVERDFEPGLGPDQVHQYDLNDRLVIYRAGRDPALGDLWREHRKTRSKGVEIGRALGYLRPLAAGMLGTRRWLWHCVRDGEVETLLWTENPGDAGDAEVAEYTARIRDELAKIGLAYSFRFQSSGGSP